MKVMVRYTQQLIGCALLMAWLINCTATPLMVTVQTQSQQQVLKATTQDTQRRLLGAMEATQSSVVDVENVDSLLPYEMTHVQNVPTLSLLDSLSFDNVTEEWSFTYETMALDASEHGQINKYYRVLYFTHTAHDVGGSDTTNRCLQPGMDYESCISYLRSDYVVLMEDPNSFDSIAKDRLESTTWAAGQPTDSCPACAINATVDSELGSARQTLHLRIPHSLIRSTLSRRRNSTHMDSYSFVDVGSQPALDFGVGMMFLPKPEPNTQHTPPNNVLVFDMFTILENTFEQIAITKRTAYSVATHVAFWTAVAYDNPLLRVVTIEYLLDVGHILEDIKISTNNGSLAAGGSMVPISTDDCAAMQALIDAMNSPLCLSRQRLCTPVAVVDGSGATQQTFVTIVFPIPQWHQGDVFQFNTMLFSNLTNVNEGRGMRALSTLNFFTSHAPRVSCAPTETIAFDATQHVRTELYRGHGLVAETITGTFSVFNDTSLSSAEALVTLVLRPDDTSEALAYFEKYSDEHLRLDELYMSHGKLSNTFPSQISNKVQGTGSGRSTLNLDPELLTRCPMYENSLQQNIECATTQDWDLQGNHARVGSSVYYVHQVFGTEDTEADDLAWLSSNVFGPSDIQTLRTFRAAVLSRPFSTPSAAQRKQHASIFWIWPVFLWPNAGPIGLVDRTVISLVWSIAP
jgi:hypothetical protein